jgi:lysozyme
MMKGRTIGLAGASAAAVLLVAAAFIQPWEGRELTAYPDIVNVWTICDGDTNNVRPGQVATEAECDERLVNNLRLYSSKMRACMTRPVPVKTEAAFLELTYNVGWGAFCNSTLVKRANAGDFRGACDELLKWVRAGGKVVRGLQRRRDASHALCLEGVREGI